MTTDHFALHPGPARDGGYRPLQRGPGEPHVHRTDLAAPPSDGPAAGEPVEVLLTVAHMSDLHVCDHQSPARIEFLDRWADPDSPVGHLLGEVGTYRAQELLTAQVVDACVRALNEVTSGPVFGRPVQLAVATGDNIDNSQSNEVEWYLTLLDGGEVQPDSGDLSRYEGVCDDVLADERYWRPESSTPDLPRSTYGFPSVPGLLDAVRRPFEAAGLTVPWLAVHGNHDQMVQGTVPGTGEMGAVAVGGRKGYGLPEGWTPEQAMELFAGLERCEPDSLAALADVPTREVTADPDRHFITRKEFLDRHTMRDVEPSGHGFRPGDEAYYRHDLDGVTVLVLDTVNEYGGWEGSLDRPQFDWLAGELTAADADGRYVVLASHHPLESMINPAGPDRVLGRELDDLLQAHPCLVLWLAGHTHAVSVTPHLSYWSVVAPSLIDWPQQARIVELVRTPSGLRIAATMIDHAGEAPWGGGINTTVQLAGLSRELAANDWQARRFDDNPREGRPDERNVVLYLADPFA